MKAIRVSDQTHAKFKAACALRGLPMNATADVALNMLMETWHAQDEERNARIAQAQERK